ncbi:hypothetical protein VKS41_000671 [Umbelopsis sp. WA50703]|jgi:hypothetical protein
MALLNQLNSKLHRFISEIYPPTRASSYYSAVSQVNTSDDEDDGSNEQSGLLTMQENKFTTPMKRHRRSVCSVDTMQTIDEETDMENQKLLDKEN